MSDSEAAELYANRFDPDEWEEEAVEIEVPQSSTGVMSFRLPNEEIDVLVKAARAEEMTLSEFIRTALSEKIDGRSGSSVQGVNTGRLPTTRTERPLRNASVSAGGDAEATPAPTPGATSSAAT